MIGLLYAVYLSTLSTLEDPTITEDDLLVLKFIYDNKKQNAKINNFKNSIKSLEKLYSQINEKDNKKNNYYNNDDDGFNLFNSLKKSVKKSVKNSLYVSKRKMELFKSINNSIYERLKMVICNFCIEEYDENQIVNPILECNNHVHGECFANYIEAELNVNHFPIKCPICPNDKRHDINFKIK